MAYEYLRSGLGFVDSGNRYGYTDGSLWYLGECRIYNGIGDRNFIVSTYSQLQADVNTWIAGNPLTRTTQPTSDETKCLFQFEGERLTGPNARHEFYYQNYLYIGKPDPAPFPTKDGLGSIFRNDALGIAGVGYGYLDTYHNVRAGYGDNLFWYQGEPRIFPIKAMPSGVTEISIPSSGPTAATGIKYYRGIDANRVYVTSPESATPYVMLDYDYLRRMVDSWQLGNIRYPSTISPDPLSDGFLWHGQQYWQALGVQCSPDEFIRAIRDSERNLQIILRYLPNSTASTTGQIFVNVPKQPKTGISLIDILTAQYLTGLNKKKRKRKGR